MSDFLYCYLPEGNRELFPDLDYEMVVRGVRAQSTVPKFGGREYRIPKQDLPKLPHRGFAPLFGDGDIVFPLKTRSVMKPKEYKKAKWDYARYKPSKEQIKDLKCPSCGSLESATFRSGEGLEFEIRVDPNTKMILVNPGENACMNVENAHMVGVKKRVRWMMEEGHQVLECPGCKESFETHPPTKEELEEMEKAQEELEETFSKTLHENMVSNFDKLKEKIEALSGDAKKSVISAFRDDFETNGWKDLVELLDKAFPAPGNVPHQE